MGFLCGSADSIDDRPAVTVAGTALRRDELFLAAAAVSDRVRGAAAVALHAEATVPTVVAVLGCLLAGVPVVPVPADSGPIERSHILRDSGAQLYLGGPSPADGGAGGAEVVPVDLSARSTSASPVPGPGATALIIYTSGTTGTPKGVVLSHGALANGLDGLALAWGWSGEDVLAHGLPLFHVHGLILGVLGALRVGSPLVHTGRPQPAAYAAAAHDGATMFFGVPTVWSRIAAEPSSARALGSARLLVSGSAALPPSVFNDLHALTGQAPVERYGMTETMITLAVRADGERRPGCVGLPIDGVHTRVVDDAGSRVPSDGETIGDLQVRGGCLFDGYLGRPETTAAGWTDDGWFRTGDAAAWDEAGYHRIVGRRATDLIKSGGYRIGAGEVEAALLDHQSVAEAAVVGLPDPDLGQRVVAFVVGSEVDPDTLIQHVAAQLSAHKRPREVRVVDALPRNAMGKVQKTRLVEGLV